MSREHGKLLLTMQELWDRRANEALGPVLALALNALKRLSEFDESIFAHASEKGAHILDGSDPASALKETAQKTFSGVKTLANHLVATSVPEDRPKDLDVEKLDFSFASEPATLGEDEEGDLGLDTGDIFGAVDSLEGDDGTEEAAKVLADVRREITSHGFMLRSELKEFDGRFAKALSDAHLGKALRELDESSDHFGDALFTVVGAVCRPYMESFDPDHYLPSHRSSLEKALLVRRAVADLRFTVNELNDRMQDSKASPEQRAAAVNVLIQELDQFVVGAAHAAMRPAERLEFAKVRESLPQASARGAATVFEGFAKFVETLLVVNQRDVVVEHDRKRLNEIYELIQTARPLISLSVQGARPVVEDALRAFRKLYGSNLVVDELTERWRQDPPNLEDAAGLERTLDALVMTCGFTDLIRDENGADLGVELTG